MRKKQKQVKKGGSRRGQPPSINPNGRGVVVLVDSTVTKCPLCEFARPMKCTTARHFQGRHKLEFIQVISGKGSYPGIAPKKNLNKSLIQIQIAKTKMQLAAEKNAVHGPPVFVKSTVKTCPLCNYSSASHVGRHFQKNHQSEFQQVMAGTAQYPGIIKRQDHAHCHGSQNQTVAVTATTPITTTTTMTTDVSVNIQNISKIPSCQESKKYFSSKSKKLESEKSTTTASSILIKSSRSNCPLCKYNGTSKCNAARHFQSQHNTEFQQVMNGTGSYPGIFKKEFQQEKNDVSDVPDPVRKTSISTLKPIATEIVQMKTKEKYSEQLGQTSSEFLSTVNLKKSIQQDSDDGVDVDAEADVKIEKSGKAIEEKNQNPDENEKEKQERNRNRIPCTIYLRCRYSGCNFFTDSQYKLEMHANCHEILQSMPSFVRKIIEAPGTLQDLLKMKRKSNTL